MADVSVATLMHGVAAVTGSSADGLRGGGRYRARNDFQKSQTPISSPIIVIIICSVAVRIDSPAKKKLRPIRLSNN